MAALRLTQAVRGRAELAGGLAEELDLDVAVVGMRRFVVPPSLEVVEVQGDALRPPFLNAVVNLGVHDEVSKQVQDQAVGAAL